MQNTVEISENRNIRLGELLVAAGLIQQKEIDNFLTLAKFMGLPLGNLLVREKKLSSNLLKVAVRLQTLISSGMISVDMACRTMRDIAAGICSVDEILDSFNTYSESVRSCRLGELLVDADLLSQIALGRALVASAESSVPLGWTLVQEGTLTSDIINTALLLQQNVRACMIDYKTAVHSLKNIRFGANLAPALM